MMITHENVYPVYEENITYLQISISLFYVRYIEFNIEFKNIVLLKQSRTSAFGH